MKNVQNYITLIFWISLFIFELITLIFLQPKPMYFRAWEYILNEGRDSYYVPFKPHITYKGNMTGDLLNMVNFLPSENDIREQIFTADEYGFRNRKGTLDKKLDAVLLGTSFLGGSAITQYDLLNEILYRNYKINSYNYATLPLQHFWEDSRFIDSKPKYAVIIGSEVEILQNSWIQVLKETDLRHDVPKWSSFSEWNNINNTSSYTYLNVINYLKRFSTVKYFLHEKYKVIVNTFLSRSTLFKLSQGELAYDVKKDILFFDISRFDPTLTIENKNSINETVNTLINTKNILAKRNIKLLVVIVPSKANLYADYYKSIKREKMRLFNLEKELKKNNIDFIPTYDEMKTSAHKIRYYYNDDGHWTPETNYLIAGKMAKKLLQID